MPCKLFLFKYPSLELVSNKPTPPCNFLIKRSTPAAAYCIPEGTLIHWRLQVAVKRRSISAVPAVAGFKVRGALNACVKNGSCAHIFKGKKINIILRQVFILLFLSRCKNVKKIILLPRCCPLFCTPFRPDISSPTTLNHFETLPEFSTHTHLAAQCCLCILHPMAGWEHLFSHTGWRFLDDEI